MQIKIGVAITVHNRNAMAAKTVNNWRKMMPENSILLVVDDASDVPFIGSDFRFASNVGIATAKNKCIELLYNQSCDVLFLSDDDCYPVDQNWHVPYTQSEQGVLSFTFASVGRNQPNGNRLIARDQIHSVYNNACGCMISIKRNVVATIGGFDIDFSMYGDEHIDYAIRAERAGLNSHEFIDVNGSGELFFAHDRQIGFLTSRHDKNVQSYLSRRHLVKRECDQHDIIFKSYELSRGIQPDYVICSLFNYREDPQRAKKLLQGEKIIERLSKTCDDLKVPLVILTDFVSGEFGNDWRKIVQYEGDKDFSPNDFRWVAQLDYIQKNPACRIWMVDATDIEVLRNPFDLIDSTDLFCGYEHGNFSNDSWVYQNQGRHLKIRDYQNIVSNRKEVLLNCGIVGGQYKTLVNFAQIMASETLTHSKNAQGCRDMALFNYVCRKHFANRISTGGRVCTKFKQYEINDISVFKHK